MTETKRKILKYLCERMDTLRKRRSNHIEKANMFCGFDNVVQAELEYTYARLADSGFKELSAFREFIVKEIK